jgi:hypothetical protein
MIFFNFSQRLDPLILIKENIMAIINWKDPIKTIGIGILFTVILLQMDLAIIVVGLLLTLGKKIFLNKLEAIHNYRNIHKRLLVPR